MNMIPCKIFFGAFFLFFKFFLLTALIVENSHI